MKRRRWLIDSEVRDKYVESAILESETANVLKGLTIISSQVVSREDWLMTDRTLLQVDLIRDLDREEYQLLAEGTEDALDWFAERFITDQCVEIEP